LHSGLIEREMCKNATALPYGEHLKRESFSAVFADVNEASVDLLPIAWWLYKPAVSIAAGKMICVVSSSWYSRSWCLWFGKKFFSHSYKCWQLFTRPSSPTTRLRYYFSTLTTYRLSHTTDENWQIGYQSFIHFALA